ncbi:uncharacterized protein LOC128673729 isoform X2 [Plodia interpunctella]|uniref:uncharacterized protein LOC128673729 isoform X2 n=1 Tax=Plodia interpunctella TaxID=58824 RepID=UPI002367733D|nr:uncharacterized protein LOC128673729 isoform X2 [Plodia interpunctella]
MLSNLHISRAKPWSSYDQVPMDHNRTALPVQTLAQVMKNDRVWVLSLEPQLQAVVLLELLSLSGGPVMWAVFHRAQILYERYREDQLRNLQECIVVMNDKDKEKDATSSDKGKKDIPAKSINYDADFDMKPSQPPGQAQKELDANLAIWNSTIKAMRDSLKLEELEMTFTDGTKKNIWKVNRPKPETIETECYIQLLPSEVAKRILSYIPQAQLTDCARVNKYWAYLIDEYRIEQATQQRLEADLEKLQDLMLRQNLSIDVMVEPRDTVVRNNNISCGVPSIAPSIRVKGQATSGSVRHAASFKSSERSAGAYSFKNLGMDKLSKPFLDMKPLRNLAELSERLESRGAADENLWQWCENILKNHKYRKAKRLVEGIIPQDNAHFPCPMMKETLDVPLNPPLLKDPVNKQKSTKPKPKKNISNATVVAVPLKDTEKRFSLWSRDFSCLFPVFKIPSHASPV